MSALRPIDHWLAHEVLPHEGRYLAAARRVTSGADEAADLVQEALVRLLALDGWAAIVNPPAYVLRTIHNIAIERARRAKIVKFQHLTELEAAELRDESPDAFRVIAGQERLNRLGLAIEALPERCKTVFVRRRIRDQSPREIAGDLGISVSTFEKRLARALYLLAQALDAGDELRDEAVVERKDDSRAIG